MLMLSEQVANIATNQIAVEATFSKRDLDAFVDIQTMPHAATRR